MMNCNLSENDNQIVSSDNSIEEFAFNISNRDAVREFLKFGTKEEVNTFVDKLLDDMGQMILRSQMLRQYIVMDIYFDVVEFLRSVSITDRLSAADEDINEYSKNIDLSKEYITLLIEKAIELREEVAGDKYGETVKDVMNYIEMNYSHDDLSLNEVASYAKFSPNHLSMIFSQRTGQTFIKYLTDYRINKAKEMLRCTSKRSSRIASEVGYKDPHYFSFLFKKIVGMTPTQYRNSGLSLQ